MESPDCHVPVEQTHVSAEICYDRNTYIVNPPPETQTPGRHVRTFELIIDDLG